VWTKSSRELSRRWKKKWKEARWVLDEEFNGTEDAFSRTILCLFILLWELVKCHVPCDVKH
jgi:hypothetical protein